MAEPERTIEITRVFEASREEVWSEWTEPERFADWFGGTVSEVPLETLSMDVRPGGTWRLMMKTARGEIQWSGEYREVVEPERLVFTLTDQPDQELHHLVSVVLTDLGDGRTEMRFEQRGPMPPEQQEAAGKGWSSFFDRVADRLASA